MIDHLKNIPAPVAENIQTIWNMRMQQDVEQEAICNILKGQELMKAIQNARCDTWRNALRPSGFVSFDDENNGVLSLKESVAAAEAISIDVSSRKQHDESVECLFSVLSNGTKTLGVHMNVGQRRAQQILKAEIERQRNKGKKGSQGDLFWGLE